MSEFILIDGTFVFPDNYKQTLIIMYYDNIINKMIPSIFIVTNNKICEGYILIFDFIKRYITSYIKNELIHLNWQSFTTDFETALITAFKKTFDFIPNLKHNGCFFHYMKNIYKYLAKNKYTVKKNKSHYDYIIKNVYKLPFKSNIEKNIDKEIKKICKKNSFYKDFCQYFLDEWSKYFKDNSLVLKDIHIKIRTNNSLENFNRTFKHSFNMKSNMNFIKYIDNLLDLAINQVEFFKEHLNIQQKKKVNTNDNSNNENIDENLNELEKEIEDEISKENISLSDTENIDKINDNININNLAKDDLNNFKVFLNEYNSCSFDSYTILFINGILPNISNSELLNNNKYLYDLTSNNEFELYLNFINFIKKKITGEFIKFYDLYEEYNQLNNINLFNLDDIEYKNFVPIVINYRLLNNNRIFCIIYRISHYCTGKCKFSSQLKEELISKPFIDIPLVAYEDKRINSIDDLFKGYIYMNINTICNEEQCYSEDDKNVNFYVKKYEILELPLILSINTNLSNFNLLIKNKDFLNKILKNEIILYGEKYLLLGFVTQPYQNHFVSYFKNYNQEYSKSVNIWFRFDDINGYIEKINNDFIALSNIRSSEGLSLLVYIKIN